MSGYLYSKGNLQVDGDFKEGIQIRTWETAPFLNRDEVKALYESLGLWLHRTSTEYERRRADPLYVATD